MTEVEARGVPLITDVDGTVICVCTMAQACGCGRPDLADDADMIVARMSSVR